MTSTAAEHGVAVGDLAPDFTADSTAGRPITLSAYRDATPVLLAFFPLAFTSTCTAELCDFSTDFDRFAGAGVEVLPISVDSVPTLREFKAKHAMRIELLSDFRRDISRAYGVLLEDRFHSARAYVLIGRDGRVAWRHVEEHPGQKRTNDELLARINALR